MLLTTQDGFEDYEIVETLGLVRGNTIQGRDVAIRAKHLRVDILAGLRAITGGAITEYTGMLAEPRQQALDRMVAEAEAMGAHAVVCVRLAISAAMRGSVELLAYGTAVWLKKKTD